MSVAELEIANPNPGTLRDVSLILSRQPANVRTCTVGFYWVTNALKTKGKFRAMPFRNMSVSRTRREARHVSHADQWGEEATHRWLRGK